MRFIEKEDCWIDIQTNLMWSKEHLGHIEKNKIYSNNWRNPTVLEIASAIDYHHLIFPVPLNTDVIRLVKKGEE